MCFRSLLTYLFHEIVLMSVSVEDSDSDAASGNDDITADEDDDDDDGESLVDSSTGNCLASASQLIHLPDTQLQFHKCRDVNADRPAKVACCTLFLLQ